MKKILMGLLALIGVIIVAAAALIGILTAMEYNPDDVEVLTVTGNVQTRQARVGEMINVMTMNVGYGGLGANQDFFMDGGSMTRPENLETVERNIKGVLSDLGLRKADIYMLQEVDLNSWRSHSMNQGEYFRRGFGYTYNTAFAYNYNCAFVPFPWPPLGRVKSGLSTSTTFQVTEATRESLPVPFSWPVRVANLKRCLLVERIPVENSDKELVIVNLHLEAYDDGEGKMAQTKQLMQLLSAEYRKGNYVIAGGDFNQVFEEARDAFPLLDERYWQPGLLLNSDLPQGFSYVYDASSPTCRLLNKPYSGERSETQLYVIDGYIVSDNLRVNHVETVDLNFAHSDHHPVFLQVTPE